MIIIIIIVTKIVMITKIIVIAHFFNTNGYNDYNKKDGLQLSLLLFVDVHITIFIIRRG